MPEGFSVDFTSKSNGNGKEKMSEPNQSVQNASADGVDEGKFGQAGLLDPNRSGSTGGGQKVGQLRGSRASISAPTKERIFNPHAQNPGRIPTAGGVAVGSKQYETRRASRVSSDMGVGSSSAPKSPPLPEENGAPAGSDDKPAFNIPDYSENNEAGAVGGPAMGEGQQANKPVEETDKSAAAVGGPAMGEGQQTIKPVEETDKSAAAVGGPAMGEGATEASGATTAPASNGQATAGADADKSTTEKIKDKVKENVPGSSAAGSSGPPTSPSSPSKERRQSRFGLFKEKLTGKK